MTKTFLAWLLGAALAAALIGCNGGDDPADPIPDPCSLTISTPVAGASYRTEPSETVNIRWTSTGGASSVRIELLQGTTSVGDIAATTANDGFFAWTAAVLGGSGGDDFAIRLTALGETGCTATVEPLTILDTAACELEFTVDLPPEAVLVGGQPLDITWTSGNTTGQVSLELWHGHLNAVRVGVIAEGTADDGLYHWTVDSFNDVAHRLVNDPTVYWLKVMDADLADACQSASADFTLTDDTIASYSVWVDPVSSVYDLDQQVTINFVPDGYLPAGTVRIRLYAGSLPVAGGLIADGLSAAAQTFAWTVDNFGDTQGGSSYNVRVIDDGDEYIWGGSDDFSIQE